MNQTEMVWGKLEGSARQLGSLASKHIASWQKVKVTEAGHIRFKDFTTLSNPSMPNTALIGHPAHHLATLFYRTNKKQIPTGVSFIAVTHNWTKMSYEKLNINNS
ncbi:hypothetical protein ACOMICROBIO_FLGHMIGD_03908 [Vibrio sp. B1FLJ16]|nr:hypothetical protein ACOMICROBIO_FLGHMIGD_03908 [Vibrio sp. B1FLJ16]CAE6938618.1 hypothetical protein ACOMICROBIO_FLGHMIGD_03908 [Vibrio sp. B1FLJ16]